MSRKFRPVCLGLLAAATLASPAGAQYARTGLLRWDYDDVMVDAPQGRRRVSGFSQSYLYTVDGPLATPMIGAGRASVNFSQGKSLAQTVVTSDTEQKILGYSFSASLLPPGLRQYLTLMPSFSRTRTAQAWGEPQVGRDLVDESQGLSLGLALPKLPSVSLSRSWLARRDLSSIPVVDHRTQLRTEQVAYAKGPFRTLLRRDTNRTDDRLTPASGVTTQQTAAEAELDFPELKGNLQRAFLRTSHQGQSSRSAAAAGRQDSSAANLYLASRRFKRAAWDTYLGYAGELSRASAQRNLARNNLFLVSAAPLRGGQVSNQVGYQRADGRARQQSVTDSATGEWRTPSGRASWRANAEGGWASDASAGDSLSDALRGRATLMPRPSYDVYLELGNSGATPLGGLPGGSRQQNLATGLGLRPSPVTTLAANYTLARNRSFAQGSVSVVHGVTAQLQSSPVERLRATGSWSLNWTEGAPGSRGELLSAAVDYSPWEGLQLLGELARSGRSLNASLSAGYTIGRTRATLRFERRELYTVNSYSHLSFSLSRSL